MKKKSLNVKKIIPKSFKFNEILKDKKIFETYKEFAKNFERLNNTNSIAVSVSGGPDSLALCFLVSCYNFKKKIKSKPRFYLVDHGLRKESKKEAKTVKNHLRLKKIKLKVLKWKGKKPNSNLQNLARKKRYELLFNECNKSNIQLLLTAHHQDDFYETFFSRLLRGSGTDGLSSFTEIEKKFIFQKKIITIVRPLLSLNKSSLTYVSQKVFNFYIIDPSNKMEKYQRVRLRKLIINLKNQGLDFKKLKLTVNNLASTNKAMKEFVDFNINENVIINKKRYLIGSKFFSSPEEVVFRSFSNLIKKISQNDYPPRGKKLMNLIRELKKRNYFKATLGGTIIEKIHNSVVLTPEKTKKR